MRNPLWVRLLPDRQVLRLATLWGLGNYRPGPGTWGSVAGLAWYTVVFIPIGPWWGALVAALSLWLSLWVCGEAERRMGRTDPPSVVLDEFVAMPLCFLGLDGGRGLGKPWLLFLCGLLLFRVLDIAKPLGIRSLQRLPGGLGIVADDVAAALLACVCLHGGVRWFPAFFGAAGGGG